MENNSEFIKHVPCPFPECGSSDAGALYENGNIHCHKCHRTQFANQEQNKPLAEGLLEGEYHPLIRRKISLETCKLFRYQVGVFKGESVQIANYLKNGQIVAQKIRFSDKDKGFPWFGNSKSIGLFGDHIWGSGKKIVITEGEIDAMSVSQAMGNKWPVVSLKNGADERGTGAKKELVAQLPYLNNFEEIVLMFDMDDVGQASAHEAAKGLPIGRVKIASLPMKDANEMLVAGKVDELVNAVWRAKPYKPETLMDDEVLLEEMFTEPKESDYKYQFSILNELTKGFRPGEIVLVCGGAGLGKSSFTRQVAHSLIERDEKVGFITLEESPKFYATSLLGYAINKNLRFDKSYYHDSKLKQFAKDNIIAKTKYFDLSNRLTRDALQLTIDYMVQASNCKWIVFDHITMASTNDKRSEREEINAIMNLLRELAMRYQVGMFVVSQLRKPDKGDSYEEGRKVRRSDLNGSSSLETVPDIIIAVQGNVYDKTNSRLLTVLKNRYNGDHGSGDADTIVYDKDTGLMTTQTFNMTKQEGEAF